MEEGRSRRTSSASIVYSRSNDAEPGAAVVTTRWDTLRGYTAKHRGAVCLAVTVALLLVVFGILWSQEPTLFTSSSDAAALLVPIGPRDSCSSSTESAWSSTGESDHGLHRVGRGGGPRVEHGRGAATQLHDLRVLLARRPPAVRASATIGSDRDAPCCSR